MKNLLTLILCLLVGVSFSQTKSSQRSPALTAGSAASAGMSDERLQRIDEMCEEHVKEGKLPGMVALVAKNGRIVYHKAFGMADSPAGKPMTKDAIFRIASQSKAITSTAVMMLWEEGKFRLDDPISKYIPEFKNPKVLRSFRYRDTTYNAAPAKREITIRHLLTHTSGIGYGVIDGDERFRMIYEKAGITDLFTTEDITIEESVKKLAKLPLHHDPGEGYVYSEGLDVLGYFIELISGMSFSDFLQERLFKPLDMNDTHFYLPSELADRLVKVQRKQGDQWEHYPVTFYDTNYPITGAKRFYSGGAGLSSTAKDYATFLQMYLNGGELNGIRFLSRTTIETMMQNQIKDFWEGSGRHYGLAFGVLDEVGVAQGGRGSLGTFDWGGYFNTQYFADPKEKIIGIIMKQTRGPVDDQTGWMFRMLVGQAVDN